MSVILIIKTITTIVAAILILLLLYMNFLLISFNIRIKVIQDKKTLYDLKKLIIRLEKLDFLCNVLVTLYLFLAFITLDFLLLVLPAIMFIFLGILGKILEILTKNKRSISNDIDEEYKSIKGVWGNGSISKTNEIIPNLWNFLKSIIKF